MTVNSGGTLAGTGRAGNGTAGPVNVAGGTITAGSGPLATNSVGTLTTGSQNWSSGTYVAKVATVTGSNDVLVMSGLTVGSSFNVSLMNTSGSSPAFTGFNAAPTPNGTTPATGSYIVLATNNQSSGGTNPFASQAVLTSLTFSPNGAIGLARAGDAIVLDTYTPTGSTTSDLIAEEVAAPEPTSVLLLGGIVAPLALGRRRWRRVEEPVAN